MNSIKYKDGSKMRIATGAILMDNEPLMRTLVKIMYDFSDDLKYNDIIRRDKVRENEYKKNCY